MNQVVTGPPCSGKTTLILNELRHALDVGDSDVRLIVPTITMAEHFRNELAREGRVVRPSVVLTLSKFIADLAPDLVEPTPGQLHLMVESALDRQKLDSYARVSDLAGFRRSASGAVQEAGAAAIDPAWFTGDFGRLYRSVTNRLGPLLLHGGRLKKVAGRIGPQGLVFFDGFYSFTGPELEIVNAIAKHGRVVASLPEWDGSADAVEALRTMGFEHRRLEAFELTRLTRVAAVAATIEQEAEEIARRIVAQRAAGRAFREIGVVLRSEQPYVPVLRGAFHRFGIPARFYFGTPLDRHPVIRYLSGLMDAMLGGWDYRKSCQVLRLGGSPLAADDLFEFALRERMPGSGLEGLEKAADGRALEFFAQLQRFAQWTTLSDSPRSWATRVRLLKSLVGVPSVRDGITHDEVERLRSHAAALNAFDAAVDEAAAAFEFDGVERVDCAQFWTYTQKLIGIASLRVPDHRRDVVHVIDAHESRQWRLPVVFVCGLLEREFPKYHAEHPILNDGMRVKLQRLGAHLRTSAQRQEDEKFLFSVVATRATDQIVFSYPEINAKGDAHLPSFLLADHRKSYPVIEERSSGARPEPLHPALPIPFPRLNDVGLQTWVAARHTTMSASQVERFLQCPYLFFSESTLRLKSAPTEPWDRLDARVQGSLIHKVLELHYRDGLSFDDAFEAACAKVLADAHVPDGYRTEAIRLEMRENLVQFLKHTALPPNGRSRYENRFELQMSGGVTVRGRIDRIDLVNGRLALVIDYKYSADAEKYSTGHEAGWLAQGGLYLAALPQFGDFEPGGMVYAGLRGKISYGGWISASLGLKDLGLDHRSEDVRAQIGQALGATQSAIEGIRSGNIAPKPADATKCRLCDLRDVCRVEAAAEQTMEANAT